MFLVIPISIFIWSFHCFRMWSSDYFRMSCLQREEKKREVMEGEVNLQRIQMKYKVCYDVT